MEICIVVNTFSTYAAYYEYGGWLALDKDALQDKKGPNTMLTGTLAHGYILYSVLSPSYYTIHSDPKCEKKHRFWIFCSTLIRKIHQKGICLEQNTAAVKEDKVGQHHKLYPLQRLLFYTLRMSKLLYRNTYHDTTVVVLLQLLNNFMLVEFSHLEDKSFFASAKMDGAAFLSKLRRSSKPDKKSKCKLWCTKINALVALQGGAGKQCMENEDAHSSTPSRGGRGKKLTSFVKDINI